MIEAWRIVKTRYVETAFDGEGARRTGGRWNSPGRPVIYTSGSVSLATLEILVHLGSSAALEAYSMIPVELDEKQIEDVGSLPEGWRTYPAPAELQTIGDRWIEGGRSLALRVPSAVIETELNYLINPLHEEFEALKIGEARRFTFDPRIRSQK